MVASNTDPSYGADTSALTCSEACTPARAPIRSAAPFTCQYGLAPWISCSWSLRCFASQWHTVAVYLSSEADIQKLLREPLRRKPMAVIGVVTGNPRTVVKNQQAPAWTKYPASFSQGTVCIRDNQQGCDGEHEIH